MSLIPSKSLHDLFALCKIFLSGPLQRVHSWIQVFFAVHDLQEDCPILSQSSVFRSSGPPALHSLKYSLLLGTPELTDHLPVIIKALIRKAKCVQGSPKQRCVLKIGSHRTQQTRRMRGWFVLSYSWSCMKFAGPHLLNPMDIKWLTGESGFCWGSRLRIMLKDQTVGDWWF